jgi:hypothetical protein
MMLFEQAASAAGGVGARARIVTTIGGKSGEPGHVDGTGVRARFNEPLAIALSTHLSSARVPTVFVSEGSGQIRWLRRVQWSTGGGELQGQGGSARDYLVGTIQGLPPLWTPRGLCVVPGSDALIVSDTGRHCVWEVHLRSGMSRRRRTARRRLALAKGGLHPRLGADSATRLLSPDLAEALALQPCLSPPLARALAAMRRPPLPAAAVAEFEAAARSAKQRRGGGGRRAESSSQVGELKWASGGVDGEQLKALLAQRAEEMQRCMSLEGALAAATGSNSGSTTSTDRCS